MASFQRRIVIREDDLEIDLLALFGSAKTGDHFLEGAEDLLSRDPGVGFCLEEDASVWILPMAPVGDKSIALYHTFDDETVILLSLSAF